MVANRPTPLRICQEIRRSRGGFARRQFFGNLLVTRRSTSGGRVILYWIGIWTLLPYSILARLATFGLLKQNLGEGSLFWSGTPPYVEVLYLRNRRKIGSRRLDLLVASLIPSLVAGLILLFLESELNE